MSVKSFSDFGKIVSELGTVATAALWSEELQKREFRGLGDTREAARGRVADEIGVPANFLKKLRYRAEEVVDVPGTILIRIAVAYERLCAANENVAESARAERHLLRAERHAAHQINRGQGHGNRPALA